MFNLILAFKSNHMLQRPSMYSSHTFWPKNNTTPKNFVLRIKKEVKENEFEIRTREKRKPKSHLVFEILTRILRLTK